MKTTDFIRTGLDRSAANALTLIEDMRDAPLTFPTAAGGNHPLWVLGHVTVAEAMLIQTFVLGRAHPYAHWMPIFGPGTTPTADASSYPTLDVVLRAFKETRAATHAALDSLTDADLDRPSRGCPPEFASVVGTNGQCFFATIYHIAMHTGQVADARRSLNREPLLFRPPTAPSREQSLASVA